MPRASRRGHALLLGTLLLLATLAGLSRWLDRPRTVEEPGYRTEGPWTLAESGTMPAGLEIFTPVWVAQSDRSGDFTAGLIIENLPLRTPCHLGLAGDVRDPITIRWTAAHDNPGGELSIAVKGGVWHTIALPSLESGQEISIGTMLHSSADRLQVSRPVLTGAWYSPTAHLVGRVATSGLTFLWIALLTTIAALLLRKTRPEFSGTAAVVVAWFIVAVVGYVVFWAYFAHPVLGDICVFALAVLAFVSVWRWPTSIFAIWANPGWWRPWSAVLGLGALYLGFEHAWVSDAPWSWLAGNRYNPGLPGDNWLPQLFADFLVHGRSPRNVDFEWMSSDRPPLQAGWILLLGPLLRGGAYSLNSLSQAMGLWFQLLWVPVVLTLFEQLGVTLRRAVMLTVIVALTGFVVVHSLFVWPKLASGAFVLGAWTLRERGLYRDRRGQTAFAGLGLALGFLSHGGAAFSILPLLVLWWFPLRRDSWRAHAVAALLALAVCAPWFAYQRFYQPPGNHLLKWHLAGVVPVDERGTWQTLRDSYAAKTWRELWAIRRANAHFAFVDAEWDQLWRPTAYPLYDSRVRDFFYLLRSIGWWNLGLLALPVAWWWRVRRVEPRERRQLSSLLRAVLIWVAATLLVWLALMFERGGTAIHQGSYVPPLVLLALAVWALNALHPVLLAAVAIPSGYYFAHVYAFSSPVAFSSSLEPAALVCSAAGAVLLVVAIVASARPESTASEITS